jgi:hypothetical protein
VLRLQDQYGLHAFVTAVENAGLARSLATDITADTQISSDDRKNLLEALRTGKLSTVVGGSEERLRAKAAAQS